MFPENKIHQQEKPFQIKIGVKLGLSLLLVAIVILGGNAAVFYTQSLQAVDGAIIDAAGRDRMLSQRIGYYSEMVARGHEDDQKVLTEIINLHNDSFFALKDGGVAPGIADNKLLPATKPDIMPIVLEAEDLWIEYKRNAEVVASSEVYINGQLNPKIEDALDFIEDNSPEMLRRNNEMVKAYVEMNDNKQLALNRILYMVGLIGISSLLLTAYIVRSVVVSVLKLTKATKLLSTGDSSARSNIKSNDEMGSLSRAFNIMADKISKAKTQLEADVKSRTKELEGSKTNLENQQKAVLNILEDVQETKQQLIISEKRFKDVTESSSDFIWETNKLGQYTYIAGSVQELLGYKPEEMIGKTPFDFMPKEEVKKISQIFKKITANKKPIVDLENLNLTKNGKRIYILTNGVPILDKQGIFSGYRGVDKDITRLKEIDRMKTEFISLASHQLRTPLSAMKWFLEMLIAGDAGKLNKEQKEMIGNVDASNERMIGLVNSLLNISRIESGRIIIDPKPTDLSKLVKEIVTELGPKLKKRGQVPVISAHQSLGKISLDPKLIGEVFKNLLTNAMKYSPKGGEISIFISKKDNQVISQVSDTGMGIPQKEQSKVFQKFFRGENVVRTETDGTGLGLYLVKAIIESSGGKVWFESKKDKGTTFWFSLPLSGGPVQKGSVSLSPASG